MILSIIRKSNLNYSLEISTLKQIYIIIKNIGKYIICLLLFSFSSCIHNINIEELLNTILEKEMLEVPLRVQEFCNVCEAIEIDSIRIINNDYPFEALLYTTWKLRWETSEFYDDDYTFESRTVVHKEDKTVIVKVNNIEYTSLSFKTATWKSDWQSSYYDIKWKYINR